MTTTNKQTQLKRGQMYFLREDKQMAIKHMRRYLTSLITREIQLKTSMRCHLTSIRMAIIQETENNKCWQGCGEIETLVHC